MATNNNGSSGLELLNSDYQTARDSLLNRVQARWTQSWNDFLANSFGRVLVDLIAWTRTNIVYTYNRLVAENFVSTMQLRESAARIGSLVDYRLSNPGPATVLCEAILSSPAVTQISLFKGTLIQSSDSSGSGVVFELSANYTIPAGATYPQQQVLYIGLNGSSANTLQSLVMATAGSTYLDVADATIDLTTLLSAGQVVTQANPSGTVTYLIQAITNAPTGSSNNRLIISPAWSGATGSVELNCYERRIQFVQGQTYSDNYATGPVVTGTTLFPLTQSPVIDGSSQVTVDGTLWTEVDSLALSGPTDTVYQIKLASNGSSVVAFGDGTAGSLLPPDAVVVVSYRVGGGTSGNIALATINTTMLGSDFNGNSVTVSVANQTSPGEGGTDLETLQQARLNIPAYINTNRRAVTTQDYATIASGFVDPVLGSVTYARATTLARNALVEGNIVFLYAWTTGPGGSLIPLSPALKTSLKSYLQSSYAVGTGEVLIADGTAIPTPVSLRFAVLSGFDVVAVNSAVQAAIYSYVAALKPGDPIVFSTLLNTLTSIAGVNSVTVSTPSGDISPSSSTQIFTPPNAPYSSTFDLVPDDTAQLIGQSPVVPLQPWSGVFSLGGNVLTMLPSPINGQAILIGPGLASQRYGPLASRPAASATNSNTFWYDTDSGTNALSNGTVWSAANGQGSGVNLSNGQVRISTTSSFSSASLQLTLSQGYTAIRTVPIFVGYTGDNSTTKRNQIRSNLRSWNAGFSIGQSLFATILTGATGAVLLDASRCNVSDTILATAGVTSVDQVALGSPGNSSYRLDVGVTELIVLGDITLNGSVN